MTDEQVAALEEIRNRNPKKLLVAAEVVEAAKDTANPLHGEFTWDDTEAARKHREMEARTLIRAFVYFEPRIDRTARGYISVPTDRQHGGGYRPLAGVLDRPDFVSQLVEEVKKKIESLKVGYRHLTALDPLWIEIDQTVTGFLAKRTEQKAA